MKKKGKRKCCWGRGYEVRNRGLLTEKANLTKDLRGWGPPWKKSMFRPILDLVGLYTSVIHSESLQSFPYLLIFLPSCIICS